MPNLSLTDPEIAQHLDLEAERTASRILRTFTHFYAMQPGTVDWPTFKRLYRIAIDMHFDVCFIMASGEFPSDASTLGLTSDRRANQLNTHLSHFLDETFVAQWRLTESDIQFVAREASVELDLDDWEAVLRDIHAKCVAKLGDLLKDFRNGVAMRNTPTYDAIFPATPAS